MNSRANMTPTYKGRTDAGVGGLEAAPEHLMSFRVLAIYRKALENEASEYPPTLYKMKRQAGVQGEERGHD